MTPDDYTAIFCPNCGIHLNEVDEQDTDDDATRIPSFGSVITCGWCGVRTADWGHVRRCRRTAKARAALALRQEQGKREATKAGLLRMITELQADPLGKA